MDKTKKMYDAYMTLEASFIMPLAVFLIAALMYLSFYCLLYTSFYAFEIYGNRKYYG